MDARNYLSSRGWKGDGHGIGATYAGIKKPLLISKKVDVLGVGLNKHTAVSDQWWLRAFDQGLKDFGTGKQGALAQVQKHGHSRGGLYGRFVRGERLEGSGDSTPVDSGVSTPSFVGTPEGALSLDNSDAKPNKKRKRDAGESTARTSKRKNTNTESGTTTITSTSHVVPSLMTVEQDKAAIKVAKRTKQCLNEAYRRGIIPAGPKEIARGRCPREGVKLPPLSSDDHLSIIYNRVEQELERSTSYEKLDAKTAKVERLRAKRILQRIARDHFAHHLGLMQNYGNSITCIPEHEAEEKRQRRVAKEEKHIRKSQRSISANEQIARIVVDADRIPPVEAAERGLTVSSSDDPAGDPAILSRVGRRPAKAEKKAKKQSAEDLNHSRALAKGMTVEAYLQHKTQKKNKRLKS